MKRNQLFVMGALALGLSFQAKATIIAVIDSGTDLSHPALVDKKWTNPIDVDDGVDNDNNGYIDDINGWNFADGNNKLYDKSFLGTFSPDTYNFFAVQTRLLKGTGTQADLDWIRAKEQDASFIASLETFANFVHGTHVAGLVSHNVSTAQVMVLKIMPTKKPSLPGTGGATKPPPAACAPNSPMISDAIIKAGLKLLASAQGKAMAPWGAYVNEEKARIANCSFGISTTEATSIIKPVLQTAMRCTPSDAVVQSYSAFFVQNVVESQKILTTSAPNTLFFIAAGNDGTDNDALPSSPANIKADNTLTVAATLDYKSLATFSNYGKTMVEVAAPGVGIESSIPGNMYLTVSGTSQATPFVTNVAGRILDADPTLTNVEVKQILMGTVDLKDFLNGKVVSGGIVNPERAVLAATMVKTHGIDTAIATARQQVADVIPAATKSAAFSGYEGYVMPMPTLFN
jgi:cell wall-associated protease